MGDFFDWIMNFIYGLASAVMGLLPNSPFQTDSFKSVLASFGDLMSNINYFIPFGSMLDIMSLFTAAALIWYGVRWILRLAQYIE